MKLLLFRSFVAFLIQLSVGTVFAADNPQPSRADVGKMRAAHAALRSAPLEVKITYLLDRAEITDLVTAYGYSVDTRDWDLQKAIFTDEYQNDSSGKPAKQTAAQRGAALAKFFTAFEATQHLVFPETFSIEGDKAYVTASLHARHYHSNGDPEKNTLLFGQYEFWLTRTADGWRIARMNMVNRTKFTTSPGLVPAAK